MIALPNLDLAVSDASLMGPDAAEKTAGTAEDFLALLAGALTQTANGDGEKTTPLNHGDTPTLRNADAREQSLTKWLVQQEAARATVDAGPDVTAPGDAQILLSSLAEHLRSELSANNANSSTRDADDKTTDDRLSDDELESLNALMAMLPITAQAQQTTNTPAPSQTGDSLTPLHRGGAKSDGFVDVKGTPTSQPQTNVRALPADSAFVIPAQKAEAESAPSPTAPTATLAPIAGHNTATVATPTVVTANVNAPLGSPDWQQHISQHITLFTRQGQQTAELRLHPESLGQVHITLKVEDNLAQIQMASPHSHVRAALEAALPVLRSQLEDNGIQLGQSNISSDGFAGQQQPSSQQSYASRGEPAVSESQEEGERLAVPAALHHAARGDNAVDIFA